MSITKGHQKIKIISIIIILIFCFLFFPSPSSSVDTQATVIRLGPWLQNVSENTITVCWTTNENNSGSNKVEYGENTGVYTHEADADTNDTTSSYWGAIGGWTKSYDYFGEYIQIAQLTSPWETFYYRVNSSGTYSNEFHYTLPGSGSYDDEINFIIWGDTQPDTQTRCSYCKQCFDDMISRENDVDLIIHMGDVVGYPYLKEIWGNMTQQLVSSCHQLNTMTVSTVGCHEYTEDIYTQLYAYRDFFHPPPNNYNESVDGAGNLLNKQWFSFDYKQIHFVSVQVIPWRLENCALQGFQGCDCLPTYAVGSPLYNWLESDLQNASNDNDISFILCFGHTSPYRVNKETECYTGTTADWLTSFGSLFDQYGVDVYFQGHDHFFLRTKRIYNNETVEAQPEDNGTTYYTCSSEGCNWQPKGGIPDGVPDDIEDFYATGTGNRVDPGDWPSNWGYLRCNVSEGNLTIKAIRYNTGAVLDTFTLNKSFKEKPEFISIDGGSNGTTLYNSTPIFVWDKISDAVNYHLQIASDSDFSSLLVNISDINEINYPTEYDDTTNVTFTLPEAYELQSYGLYYCRVRALE